MLDIARDEARMVDIDRRLKKNWKNKEGGTMVGQSELVLFFVASALALMMVFALLSCTSDGNDETEAKQEVEKDHRDYRYCYSLADCQCSKEFKRSRSPYGKCGS